MNSGEPAVHAPLLLHSCVASRAHLGCSAVIFRFRSLRNLRFSSVSELRGRSGSLSIFILTLASMMAVDANSPACQTTCSGAHDRTCGVLGMLACGWFDHRVATAGWSTTGILTAFGVSSNAAP